MNREGQNSGTDAACAPAPEWLDRSLIVRVPGALKPSAYVGRAYRAARQSGGGLPSWARKQDNGQWLFRRSYIEADARDNLAYIGISEAARAVGATRRAVQTWVDEGLIEVEDGAHREPGRPRRILRAAFERALPDLRARLETAPVVGQRRKHGKPVRPEVLARLERERQAREAQRRRQESAAADRRLAEARDAAEKARRERERAERALAASREGERAAAQEEARLRRELQTRLAQARRARQRAAGERTRAAREAKTKGRLEQKARALERALRARLAALGKRPEPPQEEKKRSAAALEARLVKAREARHRVAEQEALAETVAARLQEEMFDQGGSRVDAAIRFHDMMQARGIDDDVEVRVMRKYFGK